MREIGREVRGGKGGEEKAGVIVGAEGAGVAIVSCSAGDVPGRLSGFAVSGELTKLELIFE